MMKQTRMRFSFSLRATAMFVLIAFISTTAAWGAPSLSTGQVRSAGYGDFGRFVGRENYYFV